MHNVCNPVPADTVTSCNSVLSSDMPIILNATVSWPNNQPWPSTNPGLTTEDYGGLMLQCGLHSVTLDGGSWDWDVMLSFPSADHPLDTSTQACAQSNAQSCIPTADGYLTTTSFNDRVIIGFYSPRIKASVYVSRPSDPRRQAAAALEVFHRLADVAGLPQSARPTSAVDRSSAVAQNSTEARPNASTPSRDSAQAPSSSTHTAQPTGTWSCDDAVLSALRKVVDGEATVDQAAWADLPNGLTQENLQSAVNGYHRYLAEGISSADALAQAAGPMVYACHN
ncbi:hypothetical protein GCM10027258_47980 [Amycolatopsis stemonae]